MEKQTKVKKTKEKVEAKPSRSKVLKAPLFSGEGELIGEISLNTEIFGNKVNEKLIAQALRVYLANQRLGAASTKTRSEVEGSGAKPWRQKGTGRARAGSKRAPHWKGGGVAHGPRPKSFNLELPKKMKRKALLSALSAKASENEIVIIDKIVFKEPKTKTAANLLAKMRVKGKSLVILESKDEAVKKSFNNLPKTNTEPVENLTTYEILNNKSLIFTKRALEKADNWYIGGGSLGSK
ncbi:MAG: 50S ribosomal protein L4 [Candidatus Woykebacteria bacterium]